MKKIIFLIICLTAFGCASRHNLLLRTYNIHEWDVPITEDATLYIMAKEPSKKPEMLFGVVLEKGHKDILYIRRDTIHDEFWFDLSSGAGGRSRNIFGGAFRPVLEKKKLNPKGATRLFESYDKKTYIYSYIKKESQKRKEEINNRSTENRTPRSSIDNNSNLIQDNQVDYSNIKKEVVFSKDTPSEDVNLYHNEYKDDKWNLTFSEIERTDNYSTVKVIDKTGYDPVGSGMFFVKCIYDIAKQRNCKYFFSGTPWKDENGDNFCKVYFFNDKDMPLKDLLGDDYSEEAQSRFNLTGYLSVVFYDSFFSIRR